MRQAGKYRQRVKVQKRTSTSDGMGGDVVTWQDHTMIWANMVSLSSRERGRYMQSHEVEVTYTVHTDNTFKPRNDDLGAFRFVWGGRVFYPQSGAFEPSATTSERLFVCSEAENG